VEGDSFSVFLDPFFELVRRGERLYKRGVATARSPRGHSRLASLERKICETWWVSSDDNNKLGRGELKKMEGLDLARFEQID